jgi:hypothetical protein
MANEYIETLNKLTEAYRDLDASYRKNHILSEQIKNLRQKVECIKNHAYINKNSYEYQQAKIVLDAIDNDIYGKGLVEKI